MMARPKGARKAAAVGSSMVGDLDVQTFEAERVEAELVEAERVEDLAVEAQLVEGGVEVELVEDVEDVEAQLVEAQLVEDLAVEGGVEGGVEDVEAGVEAGVEDVEAERVEAQLVEAERVEAQLVEAERVEAQLVEGGVEDLGAMIALARERVGPDLLAPAVARAAVFGPLGDIAARVCLFFKSLRRKWRTDPEAAGGLGTTLRDGLALFEMVRPHLSPLELVAGLRLGLQPFDPGPARNPLVGGWTFDAALDELDKIRRGEVANVPRAALALLALGMPLDEARAVWAGVDTGRTAAALFARATTAPTIRVGPTADPERIAAAAATRRISAAHARRVAAGLGIDAPECVAHVEQPTPADYQRRRWPPAEPRGV